MKSIIDWIAERWVARYIKEHPPTRDISESDLAQMENPKYGIISFDDDLFVIRSEQWSASVRWRDINEILVYKRDLLTTDLICMAIVHGVDEAICESHEEMQGYVKLWRSLESRLPGFKEAYSNWLLHSPAFDSQPTSIWKGSIQPIAHSARPCDIQR